MDYAVIATSGSQYVVSVGDVLELPTLNLKDGEEISFDQVLLQKIGDEVKIGTPLLSGVLVKGKMVKNYQGEKIDIIKFKAKSRYRRKMGFRAQLASVEIQSIGGASKAEEKVSKTAKKSKS